jgi:hypothetical protein
MRWLISSWLVIVGVCGLSALNVHAQETSWHLAPSGYAVFAGHNKAAAVTSATDLCAPCSDGTQCSSGLCPIANATDTGFCSQKCNVDGTIACPTGFTCINPNDSTVDTCIPNDATVCPAIYIGTLLNDECFFPDSASDGNGFNRPCADGLACVLFPASGIGACLNKCSSIDPDYLCNPNQRCCFGLDSNGTCLASTSPQTLGGCVQIQSVGDSCVDADQSVCVTGAICVNTEASSGTDKCFGSCAVDSTSCPYDGTCATINGEAICCDASQYNPEDQTTCFPIPGTCQLNVGVACTSNADCKTSQCKTNGTAKACSSPCNTADDCPSDTADVNGDGVADGGSLCITLGTTGNYCWPKTTPATQPNCFFLATQQAAAGQDSGCTCQSAPAAPLWWLALMAFALRCGRKCRAQRLGPPA